MVRRSKMQDLAAEPARGADRTDALPRADDLRGLNDEVGVALERWLDEVKVSYTLGG